MTTMPLNFPIYLKHLFYPLNTRFYPRNKHKKIEKGSAKCEHLERDQEARQKALEKRQSDIITRQTTLESLVRDLS